eukprot:gene7357-6912_t
MAHICLNFFVGLIVFITILLYELSRKKSKNAPHKPILHPQRVVYMQPKPQPQPVHPVPVLGTKRCGACGAAFDAHAPYEFCYNCGQALTAEVFSPMPMAPAMVPGALPM